MAALTEHGTTVVYVTHDRELAARAGARIELLDGRIVARQGTHARSQTFLAAGHPVDVQHEGER